MSASEYIGTKKSTKVSYNRKDAILYAIGIGSSDLRYVYENDKNFAVFPTYPIVLGFKGTSDDVVSFPSPAMMETMIQPPLKGVKVGLDGERYLEILSPLPKNGGEFTLTSELIGVHKKGKGALVESEAVLTDASGKPCVKIVSGAFLVGAKGFEDVGESRSESVEVPNRAPDAVEEMTTSPHQAQLYRLSGDYNALHVDPMMAKMSGFEGPILHGLCTFGHAARAVLKHFADNDAAAFKAIRVRFASPVMPGETLVTEMWDEGSRIVFTVKVKERNKVVINHAYVLLNNRPARSRL